MKTTQRCLTNSDPWSEFLKIKHFSLKISSVDDSTQLELSLSMDGGLKQVGHVNFTVYDSAPNVTTTLFGDTADEIEVYFDKEVEFAVEETCDNFLESETVSKLGQDPTCNVLTTVELVIRLGNGANITVDDSLKFKDNVFKALGQSFGRFLNGSFLVGPPSSPLIPVAEVTGRQFFIREVFKKIQNIIDYRCLQNGA